MKKAKHLFFQLIFSILFLNITLSEEMFIPQIEARALIDSQEQVLHREGDYPKLYINEFVASNSNSLYDEKTKSYPDWIEIYNPNNFEVDLSGYFLSDNPNKITKHQLSISSDLIIPAKGFTVLFADGNEKVSALHLSFSLSASGESIVLTAPDGITIIDSITFEEQSTDISYGRETDGNNTWVYFSTTTPNQTNSLGDILNSSFSNPPLFSKDGGVYGNTFVLELSSSKPEASIFYTTDGSEPKIENLGGTTYEYKQSYHPNNILYRAPSLYHNINTYIYDSPIDLSLLQEKDLRISDVNAELRINGITPPIVRNNAVVIRAIAIEPEKEASDIITQTYFFDNENFNSNNLAAISISLNEDQFVGFKDGIYVPGEDYEKSIIPGLLSPANYRREGIEAEIPANFEIYENGIKTVDEKIGFRIHGNITRNFVPRSFRIYARKEYGSKEINYPIFKGNSYDKYKRIILRNSGQDYNQSYFKDAMIQSLMSFTNIDYQNYRPFNVYINGEYWGILNARERIDKHYLKYKYDLNEENVDILENALTINVKEGDDSNYKTLLSQINNTNPNSNEFSPLIAKYIDIDNFIDYHILETYANNNDWPTNNVIFWRYKTNQEPTSQKSATDGRWRWALVDIDLGFQQQSINNNHINRLLTDRTSSTQIFRRLMQNSEIKSQFITRYTDLLNTAFKPERVLDEIEKFENSLNQDFADHIQRWNKPISLEGWQNNIENLRKFATQRQDILFKNIKNSFNLKELESVSVDVDDYNKGYIKVNTIEIDTTTPGIDKNIVYPWTGQYFKERIIQFVALPRVGYEFSHWELDHQFYSANDTLQINLEKNILVKAYFNVDESMDNIFITDVSSCPYEFTEWFVAGENEEFPNNMSFYYMEESDPSIHSNISGILKDIQFNYQSKTRINALGSKGLSLINTSSENENYLAKRLGIIALSVSTKSLNNIRLKFTAGTILANPRKYNLRLQYRIGTNGAIFDVYDANNQLVEYLGNEQSGHEQSFDILLPQELMNKDTVQLLWRYYYSGKQNDLTTNQRDELRLDDIFIINEDYKQTIDTIENNNINEKTLVAHIEGNSYQWYRCEDDRKIELQNETHRTLVIHNPGYYAVFQGKLTLFLLN